MAGMVHVFAHRGSSGAHPEMTRAAFVAAIDLARQRGVRLGLECDVHFTADGVLGCLHDRTVTRTGRRADGTAPTEGLADLDRSALAAIDFGSWRADLTAERALTPEERQFVHLAELLDLVEQARDAGVDVHLAIEAKHPVPRDAEVEAAIAAELTARGWTGADAPVRMITFDATAVARMAELLPELPQTFLVDDAESWAEVPLRADIAIGPGGRVLADDPDLVARVHAAGRECHVWTLNEPEHIRLALELGVDAVTSDFPDRVLDQLA